MVSGAAAPSPATPMGPIRQFCFTHPARFKGHGGPAKVLEAAREAHRIVFGKQKTIDHRNHIFPNTFLATLLFGRRSIERHMLLKIRDATSQNKLD
jgi:hypothetical protein